MNALTRPMPASRPAPTPHRPDLERGRLGEGERRRPEAAQQSGRTTSLQPPLKAGLHVARCCGWVELGTQPGFAPRHGDKETGRQGESKPQKRVLITFLIRGAAGETWRVSREFALSFGPKAALRKLLEQWRGKPYASDAAARAVDPRRVLEAPGLVSIRLKQRGVPSFKSQVSGSAQLATCNFHPETSAQPFPVIDGVLPLMAGMEAEPLRWPPVFFSWAKPERDTFLHLPRWVQQKLRASAEWRGDD